MKLIESNRIEFKRELTKDLDIEKEIVAFLNYREGGMLYIGIDDDGTPVGVKDIDGDMLKLKDRIRKGISPSPMGLFDVCMESIDNVPVIRVFVASGSEKPYYKTLYGMSGRGCYMRVGTAAEPMTTSQIEEMFSHRVHNSIKNMVSPRQDLTFTQLRIYYQEHGLSLNDNFLRTLELLTNDGRLNYAAYLLADENGNSMKLAKYAGSDRYELVSNNEYGYCCLLTAAQKVLDKLDVENKVSSVITPTGRHDTLQWNKIAIREALINAIVHNDYSYEAPSKVELFSDHLEITSIGRIPDGLSKEDFFKGVSVPRNKELMRVFRDVEMVEALGSGMLRIMRTYGLECYEFGDNFIRFRVNYGTVNVTANDTVNDGNVTVSGESGTVNVTVNDENVTVSGESGTVNVTVNDSDEIGEIISQLNERQIEILKYIGCSTCNEETPAKIETIVEYPFVNYESMAQQFGVVKMTIKRDFDKLRKVYGLVCRVGADKNGVWLLTDKGMAVYQHLN